MAIQLSDIGRALGRVVAGRGSPRDLGQLRDGLGEARRIRDHLSSKPDQPALLKALLPRLGGHGALTDWLSRALVPTPPTERSQGGFIAGALGYANANGGFPWILLLIQVIIAAIGVAIVAGTYGRRGARR